MKEKLVLIILFFLFRNNYVYSAFFDYGWSARAEGMGGSFVALSDEPSGIFYNPAGINFCDQNTFQLLYLRPFAGLKEINFDLFGFSSVFCSNKLKFGFSLNNFNANNLYRETVGIISFASGLKYFSENFLNLSFGCNIKILRKKYYFDDDTTKSFLVINNSKTFFSYDFGSIYKINQYISIGFSFKDFIAPNAAIFETKDVLPATLKLGGLYNFGDIKVFDSFLLEDVSLFSDVSFRDQEYLDISSKINYSIGVESRLFYNSYHLRCGANRHSISFGFGVYKNIANFLFLILDYASVFPIYFENRFINHKISFCLTL